MLNFQNLRLKLRYLGIGFGLGAFTTAAVAITLNAPVAPADPGTVALSKLPEQKPIVETVAPRPVTATLAPAPSPTPAPVETTASVVSPPTPIGETKTVSKETRFGNGRVETKWEFTGSDRPSSQVCSYIELSPTGNIVTKIAVDGKPVSQNRVRSGSLVQAALSKCVWFGSNS